MRNALVVQGDQSELLEKIQSFVARTRCSKPLIEGGIKRVHVCRHNRLLVKTDHSRLAALLTQTNDVIRGHFAFAAADSMKMTVWTLVHIQASRDVHLQDGCRIACGVRQLPFLDPAQRRRFDPVVANAQQPMLQHG